MVLDDPDCLASVDPFHVVILPQRRGRVAFSKENKDLTTFRAFDVYVRWFVLSGRAVQVNLEVTVVVESYHADSITER